MVGINPAVLSVVVSITTSVIALGVMVVLLRRGKKDGRSPDDPDRRGAAQRRVGN
jgi:hypothetical protein